MIVRILITLVICVAIIYGVLWLMSGGLHRAFTFASLFDNPINLLIGSTSPGAAFRLPWQQTLEGAPVDDTSPLQNADGSYAVGGTNGEHSTVSQKTDIPVDVRTYGSPSPYANKVTFEEQNATDDNPASEYLSIRAAAANTGPISLAHWSLQNAVTGERFPIPPVAHTFIAGVLNTVAPVSLNPGANGYIATGISPVGVSFQENECSGYLAQFQSFYPQLPVTCPDPARELDVTAENIRSYGDMCMVFLSSLPRCHFPRLDDIAPETLTEISPACIAYATNRLSYNGCVAAHDSEQTFTHDTARMYLGSRVELWRNSHDIIRLLDGESRTVDVLTY